MLEASAVLKKGRNIGCQLDQRLSHSKLPDWSRFSYRGMTSSRQLGDSRVVRSRMSDTAIPTSGTSQPRGVKMVSISSPSLTGTDDAQLVRELQARQPAATEQFYARFAQPVRALLFRILGRDSELEDTVQEVFVRAIESIARLRDAAALRSWVMGITVRTARIRLQSRKRRRWLSFFASDELPEVASSDVGPEIREALSALSRVLDELPTDERIAVVLRFGERMTISEAAASCGVSLSTFKRRLQRGERRFRALTLEQPALANWWQGDNHER
jgi:RNA polymerase sigma-70 factor, ECF subfamily